MKFDIQAFYFKVVLLILLYITTAFAIPVSFRKGMNNPQTTKNIFNSATPEQQELINQNYEKGKTIRKALPKGRNKVKNHHFTATALATIHGEEMPYLKMLGGKKGSRDTYEQYNGKSYEKLHKQKTNDSKSSAS